MRLPAALAPACALLLAGCQGILGIQDCPAIPTPAVQVEVYDARTGRPAAGGARGWVRSATRQDSLRVVGWTGPQISDSTAYLMSDVHGRPGNYTVQVTRPGYQAWQVDGVRVRKTECGVRTAKLRAELVPEAGR